MAEALTLLLLVAAGASVVARLLIPPLERWRDEE